MIPSIKKILPHLLVILGFIIASVAYFSPVLKGEKIAQSDIIQYIGMAKQQTDYRATVGEDPYWADNAFGGMPTYQLGAQYPHNYIKKLDRLIRFLPRPADYLFLYFIGFYVLLLVLKVDYRLAFLGSLAFGFSTYYIIILGVGHNAKAHAIGYMPLVLSGIILTFRNKYLWGGILFTLAMALELVANHFQMTYYLLLLVLVLGIVYAIEAYKKKELPSFFKAIAVMVIGVIFAVGLNATNILATKEYSQFSTRGKSELTINANGTPKESKGLDYNYITEYSYGILETFNLFIPRFMGGSSSEALDKDSSFYKELLVAGASPKEASYYIASAPTYWGDQTFIGAPAYIGAVVIFMFVLALFLIKGRLKYWIVGGVILTLLLSWGRNFEFLTRFFINYVPLYDKFRAVSSIQVIIELCLPILGIVGMQKFLSNEVTKEEKLKALKYSTAIVGGLALIFLLFKTVLFSFSGPNDARLIEGFGMKLMRALREDRIAMFTADTLRALILVLLVAGSCWFFLKDKLKQTILFVILGVLIVFDLVSVNRKYVNDDNFITARQYNNTFPANPADTEILKDKGHYRVFDLTVDPFNSGRASYHHNAIGGYHAAKLGRIQDLYEFYISQNKVEILNMLNTKYIITEDKEGVYAQKNPYANGNAWFVENIKWVDNTNDEIVGLKDIKTKDVAIVNAKFKKEINKDNFAKDSLATITLDTHKPNQLVYTSNNTNDGFAVFSEVYYADGWQAYIDGNPVSYVQTDYILRGLMVPSGTHKIEFKFDPQVVKTGSRLSLASSIIVAGLILGALFLTFKKREED